MSREKTFEITETGGTGDCLRDLVEDTGGGSAIDFMNSLPGMSAKLLSDKAEGDTRTVVVTFSALEDPASIVKDSVAGYVADGCIINYKEVN